jgi:hypothetical protein
MGLLEFGLGKPIRMDIRPGFLKGIPVEIFFGGQDGDASRLECWPPRLFCSTSCASMLALDVRLARPAVQLPAAALGELALG